jgi:uncharacterized protein
MFGLSETDILTLRKTISQFPEIDKAVVFGSRAKGNFLKGSDIDIALYGKNLIDIKGKIHSQLDEETNMPYFFDVIDVNSISNKDLLDHIERIGIVIYERA